MMLKKLLPFIAFSLLGSQKSPHKIWDNRQRIVTVHCKKCGKPFKTKLQGGYMNCKECNDKL